MSEESTTPPAANESTSSNTAKAKRSPPKKRSGKATKSAKGKTELTPEAVLVRTTGRSPAQAVGLVKKMGGDASKLVGLYDKKDVAGIRAMLAKVENPKS